MNDNAKLNNNSITSKAKLLTKKPIIVFTGGGTGGHIYPNLALIPDFERKGYSVVYVGGEGDTMEKRLAVQHGIPYYALPTIKFMRNISLTSLKNNLKILPTLSRTTDKAVDLLKKLQPKAVFSKGGYASLPIVLGASKLNIPIFCHESDYTLGLANRIAAKKGAIVFKANPHAKFAGIFCGMPLRKELFEETMISSKTSLNLPFDKKILLIVGGSSGATIMNECVYKNLEELTKRYCVVHITGKGKGEKYSRTNLYRPFEYADNISLFYAASDIIVSRAGATAVFEISALKKRAIFVPLPKGASRGDQIFNAQLAQEYGAITLRQDKNFFDNFLSAILNVEQSQPMKPIIIDTNGKITSIVCDTLRRGELCTHKKLSQNGSQ